MSPVTRSLLALAALLAAARAQSNCNTKDIGRTHPCKHPVDYDPIYFNPPGVHVDTPINYCPIGMQVVGEQIETCNNDPWGPASQIDGPPPGLWTPIDVSCSHQQCPNGGTVNIRQCCDYN